MKLVFKQKCVRSTQTDSPQKVTTKSTNCHRVSLLQSTKYCEMPTDGWEFRSLVNKTVFVLFKKDSKSFCKKFKAIICCAFF